MALVGVAMTGFGTSGIFTTSVQSRNDALSSNRQLSDPWCRGLQSGAGFANLIPSHSSSHWENQLWIGRGSLLSVRASQDSEGAGEERTPGERTPGERTAGKNKWKKGPSKDQDFLRGQTSEDAESEAGKSEAERNLELQSLDKIEVAAKASIDKLRHIIYKLRTQTPSPMNTTVSGSASGSASAQLEGPDEDVFIKQDFEVELGSFSDLSPGSSDTDSSPEAEAFVHHDALTCTQTAVRIDEKTGTAVVTVTATVRGADIADQGAYTEQSVALAARALARTCLALDEKAQAALAGGDSVLKALPKLGSRPHELLTEVLQDGEIKKFTLLEEVGSSPFRRKFDVDLEIPDWQKAKAVFVPFLPGDRYLRWQRAPAEWVAYQMNLLLGLDIVPPASIRTNLQLGEEKYDMGVMVLAVEGLRPLPSIPIREWGVPSPASIVSSAHVLDALLGSTPRRPNEFKAGKHWSLSGGSKPVLIEHPMGPQKGSLHSMWAHRGELRGVKSLPATTLARLKALSHSVLFEQLAGVLTADETELILERRDQIVAYFEAMAKRHGAELVLV